jgi:hypothetical protein
MSGTRRTAIWTSSRLWLIIAAIIALPLLAEFNARLTQSRELEVQQATLIKQIDAENARHDALLKLQVWVKSDGYIEHWARTARMVKPGEVAVVPVASQINSVTSTTRATPSHTAPNDILSEWWTAFFGEAH